jgi:putative methyltransferase (TIGR04325 family)
VTTGRLAALAERLRAYRPNGVYCSGDFPTWQEALVHCTGYDNSAILDRVLVSARKVQRGEAAYERDAVCFDSPEYRFPLLWALARAALQKNRLRVLDFGGSLGSVYFQHRAVLPEVADLRWTVVEQRAHVDAGRAEFACGPLRFHYSIEEAGGAAEHDGLLLAGVLQCLPDPFGFVADAARQGFGYIILDRVPLMVSDRDRLTVQHVPERIYRASYPAWFFSETRLLSILRVKYDVTASWPALDQVQPRGGRAQHKGFLLELR